MTVSSIHFSKREDNQFRSTDLNSPPLKKGGLGGIPLPIFHAQPRHAAEFSGIVGNQGGVVGAGTRIAFDQLRQIMRKAQAGLRGTTLCLSGDLFRNITM